MLQFKAALFDLDGTLLNTLDDLTDSVNYALDRFGYPLRQPQDIRRFLGNGSKALIRRSLPEGTGEDILAKVHTVYLAWYSAHAQIKTGPYEGIPELLNELKKQDIKIAVLSNKGDGQVKALTKAFFPQADFAAGERPGIPRKPNPESVLEVLRYFSVSPQEAIYVGDSEVDIQTARNAGMTAVAVGWGFRDKEELLAHTPDFLLNHPSDLLK